MMPDPDGEPLSDAPRTVRWPPCGNTIEGIGGDQLVCTMPKGHDLDGPTKHQNDIGTKWWVFDANE